MCGYDAEHEPVPLNENTDPMGRPQFICGREECGVRLMYLKNLDQMVVDPENECDLTGWLNNYIQFARLIAELQAVGFGEELWDQLLDSMGLESDQLSELFERASFVFEREKELTFNRSPEWNVQHQQDDEPTYLIAKSMKEAEGNICIEFGADLPWQLRIFAARMLAVILNTDGRWAHPQKTGGDNVSTL